MEKELGYTVPILNLAYRQSQVAVSIGGTLQKAKYHESQILFWRLDGTFGESDVLWMNLWRRHLRLYGYVNTGMDSE